MKIHSLYSSSKGNACLIYNKTTSILIDAGVSYKKLTEAASKELKPDAVFITHEHGDHIAGAGVLGRKIQCPLYIPQSSYLIKESKFNNCIIKHIEGGESVTIGDFIITAFSTRHDSEASVGFIVYEKSTKKKLGMMADSGSFGPVMVNALKDCDAYFLEADYDFQSLWDYEDYVQEHKERVDSPWGHMSNQQALDFIEQFIDLKKVQWIMLGHLSPRTNSPELLQTQLKQRFPTIKNKFIIAPTVEPLLLS